MAEQKQINKYAIFYQSSTTSQSKQRTSQHTQTATPALPGVEQGDAGGESGRVSRTRGSPGEAADGAQGSAPPASSQGPALSGAAGRVITFQCFQFLYFLFPTNPRHFSVYLTASLTTIPWGNFNYNIIWNCWLFIVTRQRTWEGKIDWEAWAEEKVALQ